MSHSSIPGTPAYETRLLHEAMQDAKRTARDLRQAAEEHRRAADDARQARTDLETLVKKINQEIEEAPENIKLRLEPALEVVIGGVVDRLIKAGDAAKEVIDDRWQELLDHETKLLGFANSDEAIETIAARITVQVLEASKRIQAARDRETQVLKGLSELIPDLDAALGLEVKQPPVPPAAKIRSKPQGHSRNQRRRH